MKLFNRMADQLLSGLVPQVDAAAYHGCPFSRFCYCSYGVAYRRFFYECSSTGRPGKATSCQPAGTC